MHTHDFTGTAPAASPDEPFVRLAEPLIDARGSIQPIIEGGFTSAQIITSKAGTVRANHYHKTDFHYMYLLSGAFDYYHRSTGSSEEPRCLRVRAGEMVYTPPMVEHAVKFTEATTFVNFAGNARDRTAYESDLVRVELIEAGD